MDVDNDSLKILKTIFSLFCLTTLAAASRTIMSENRRTIAAFFRGVILAGFVGIISGLLIQQYDFSPATQGGVVGVAAFVADDILLFVIKLVRKLQDDPSMVIDWILRRNGK